MATTKYIIQLIVDTGSGEAKVKGVSKAFQDLESQTRRTNTALRETGTAMKNTGGAAGIAGAATAELGRTISDMPYGISAITNNISQLGSMFTLLVTSTGGFTNALRAMWTTMMGPVGVLLAFQSVIAVIDVFSRKQKEAKEKTQQFSASMVLQGETLVALRRLFLAAEKPMEYQLYLLQALATEDKNLKDLLDRRYVSQKQQIDIAREYVDALEDLRKREQEVIAVKKELENQNIEEDLSQKKLIENQKEINRLQKEIDDQVLRDAAFERARVYKISQLEGQNLRIKEQVKLLEDVSKQLIYIQNERERIDELAAQRTNFIFLTEEEQKALEQEWEKGAKQRKKEQEDEKEKQEKLIKINQQYVDATIELFDDLGIVKLNHQERDAIAEAEALGASREVILNIEKYFYEARQKLLDDDAKKTAEKLSKEEEKKKKEELKNLKERNKRNREALSKLLQAEVDLVKQSMAKVSEAFNSFSTLLSELGDISESRFQRQINRLNEERDIIRSNNQLTTEQRNSQLTELQKRENEYQRGRINAEYRMFAIRQTINGAEMIMKERAAFREQQLLAQKIIREQQALQLSLVMEQLKAGTITTLQAQVAMTGINLSAAENIGKAGMSLGTFVSQLGPLGIAAFALSIGGIIASIISAKRKASAEIAGLSDVVPLSGGSSTPSTPAAPAFNLIGGTVESQLAQAVAGKTKEPVKAYVVAGEVTTAQALERNKIKEAGI